LFWFGKSFFIATPIQYQSSFGLQAQFSQIFSSHPERLSGCSASGRYRLWLRDHRRAKVQPLCLLLFMRVGQVAIDFADQNPTVAMANPFRNCHVVNATHHGHADKVMPQIVEGFAVQPGVRPHQLQTLPEALGVNVLVAPLR
jgi:hypothetical protein